MLEGALSGRLGDGLEHLVYRWWSARWRRDWPPEEFQTGRIVASPQVACVRGYYWEEDVMGRFRARIAKFELGDDFLLNAW